MGRVLLRIWIAGTLVLGLFSALAWGGAPYETGPTLGYAGSSRSELRSLIQQVSLEQGIDPALIDAVVRVESGYNPRAVSPKGAMGLMQLMPATARRLRVDDPFDPEQNVRGGVREFSRLVDRYSGNLGLALAAYNAGEGAVTKYSGIPPYRETRSYVARIMQLYTGRAYSIGTRLRTRVPVRLVRDDGSGQVLITNTAGSASTAGGITLSQTKKGKLGGGFGQ